LPDGPGFIVEGEVLALLEAEHQHHHCCHHHMLTG
jgi:hypothetical protein